MRYHKKVMSSHEHIYSWEPHHPTNSQDSQSWISLGPTEEVSEGNQSIVYNFDKWNMVLSVVDNI